MKKNTLIKTADSFRELSDREKDILRTIIHMYILNASPVGSRSLSKQLELEMSLSPATIRNIMAELEDLDLISHPHTSAGRLPTDKGYRYYVDTLMKNEHLSESERNTVKRNLIAAESEAILKDASRLLGLLSNCLAIVEIPHFAELNLEKIELISLASNRVLVVIALDSKIVRTITIEADFEVNPKELEWISSFVNEKISGRPLKYVQQNFRNIVAEGNYSKAPLIRLFVESMENLFEPSKFQDRIHITGTQHLLEHPEFEDINRVRSVIELVENEDVIIHILDQQSAPTQDVKILIGQEMNNKLLEEYSLIMTRYNLGPAMGTIGLIGPKRMNYSHLSALVQYVGNFITLKNQ